MNGQSNYGDRFTPVVPVEKDAMGQDLPVENSDPMIDNSPVNQGLASEGPMGGRLVDPIPSMVPGVPMVPFYDRPVREGPADVVGAENAVQEDKINYRAETGEAIGENWDKKPMGAGAPTGEPAVLASPVVSNNAGSTTLLESKDAERFRTHWNEIQARFVDEPRTAVQQADGLVTEVVEQISHKFAAEHTSLESQWNQGKEVSTEDLRKALQSYRTFFNRLVV